MLNARKVMQKRISPLTVSERVRTVTNQEARNPPTKVLSDHVVCRPRVLTKQQIISKALKPLPDIVGGVSRGRGSFAKNRSRDKRERRAKTFKSINSLKKSMLEGLKVPSPPITHPVLSLSHSKK